MAPISAYRTLNLPAVDSLTAMAQGPMSGPHVRAARPRGAAGDRDAAADLPSGREPGGPLLRRPELPGEAIDDPALARWLYGASWAAEQGDWVNRFLVWRCDEPAAKAWFLPLTGDDDESMLDDWTGDPRDLLPLFDRAEPLVPESSRPEEWTIPVQADEPGWVIVSQLDDPQWTARWIGMEGQGEYAWEIRPAFRTPGDTAGGWQPSRSPSTADGRSA